MSNLSTSNTYYGRKEQTDITFQELLEQAKSGKFINEELSIDTELAKVFGTSPEYLGFIDKLKINGKVEVFNNLGNKVIIDSGHVVGIHYFEASKKSFVVIFNAGDYYRIEINEFGRSVGVEYANAIFRILKVIKNRKKGSEKEIYDRLKIFTEHIGIGKSGLEMIGEINSNKFQVDEILSQESELSRSLGLQLEDLGFFNLKDIRFEEEVRVTNEMGEIEKIKGGYIVGISKFGERSKNRVTIISKGKKYYATKNYLEKVLGGDKISLAIGFLNTVNEFLIASNEESIDEESLQLLSYLKSKFDYYILKNTFRVSIPVPSLKIIGQGEYRIVGYVVDLDVEGKGKKTVRVISEKGKSYYLTPETLKKQIGKTKFDKIRLLRKELILIRTLVKEEAYMYKNENIKNIFKKEEIENLESKQLDDKFEGSKNIRRKNGGIFQTFLKKLSKLGRRKK